MDRNLLTVGKIPRSQRKRHKNSPLPGIDGRTKQAIRFRNLAAALSLEIGEPTVAQMALVRQCALSIVLVEALQVAALEGTATPQELSEIPRLQNVIARCIALLGKRKGNAAPDLDKYLAEKRARETSA